GDVRARRSSVPRAAGRGRLRAFCADARRERRNSAGRARVRRVRAAAWGIRRSVDVDIRKVDRSICSVEKNLEEAIRKAGSPMKLLWNSTTPPAVVPRVVPEITNWRDEQLAWRRTAVLYDQSHHMADLNIKGPDALKLIGALAVNSFAKFPVDMAKQFVAVNYDGYVIGDNILFHLDEDEYQAVGIPPSINWLHYHAATGGYDVRIWRDDNSFYR